MDLMTPRRLIRGRDPGASLGAAWLSSDPATLSSPLPPSLWLKGGNGVNTSGARVLEGQELLWGGPTHFLLPDVALPAVRGP